MSVRFAIEDYALYSPDQPREPSGTSEGGRFADAGGGGSGVLASAFARFGETDRDLSYAGFVTPDGRGIDMRHATRRPRPAGVVHAHIKDLYPGVDSDEAITRFLYDTGSMRWVDNGPDAELGVTVGPRPTSMQIRTMVTEARHRNGLVVDIYQQGSASRRVVTSETWARPTVDEVTKWFDDVYARTKDAVLFDPDQPRVPAGDPDGGQWTSTGGSSASASAEGDDEVRVPGTPMIPKLQPWHYPGAPPPTPDEKVAWDKTVAKIETWAKSQGHTVPWIDSTGTRTEPTPVAVRRWMDRKRYEMRNAQTAVDYHTRIQRFESMGVPHDDAERLARWMQPGVVKAHLSHEITQNFPLEAHRRADAIGEASQSLIHVSPKTTAPGITTNPAEIVDRGLWAERELGVRLAAANIPKRHWDMMTTPAAGFTALTGIHLVATPDEAPSERAALSLAKPRVAGNYRDPFISINVTRIGDRRSAASVATHEIGHAFHAALKRAKTPAGRTPGIPYEHRVPTKVTFYGTTNPNEAFAEAYAMYASPGGRAYLALRAPATHEFMRRLYEEPESQWLQDGDRLVKRGKTWKIQRQIWDENRLYQGTIELDEDIQFAEKAEDCRWVTIRGNPVCIEGPAPQERGTRDLPRTGRAVPHKWEKDKHVPAVPIESAREEHITDSETGKPVRVWTGRVKQGEPVHVYRAISSLDELKDAAREGGWQSHGRFVVEGLEGRTQFTADPDAAVAHGQMVGQKPFKYLVQADVQGLRYKAWIVPPDQKEMAIEASMGAGLGIDEPVPLDRIQKVWRIEGKADPDDLRLGKEIHPVEWQGAKALENAKPIGASVKQPRPRYAPFTGLAKKAADYSNGEAIRTILQARFDDDLAGVAEVLDLDTVTQPMVKRAFGQIYDRTQDHLADAGYNDDDLITVYRSGPRPEPGEIVSTSLRSTAGRFRGEVWKYTVPRLNVLSWTDKLVPGGQFAEDELLVKGSTLRRVERVDDLPQPSSKPRVKIRYTLYDPDQPREPAGSDEGGQWTSGGGSHAKTASVAPAPRPSSPRSKDTAALVSQGFTKDEAKSLLGWARRKGLPEHAEHVTAVSVWSPHPDAIGGDAHQIVSPSPSVARLKYSEDDRRDLAGRELAVRLAVSNVPKTHWEMMRAPRSGGHPPALTDVMIVGDVFTEGDPYTRPSLMNVGVTAAYRKPVAGRGGTIGIKVHNVFTPAQAYTTAMHEIGHAFHESMGWTVPPNGPPGYLKRIPDVVSKYGGYDSHEAFAEAYAMYASPGGRAYLKIRFPETHEYMRRLFEEPQSEWLRVGDWLHREGDTWTVHSTIVPRTVPVSKRSSQLAEPDDDDDCQWVTIRGNPVCIKKATGEITKGPAALVGRTITDLKIEEAKERAKEILADRPVRGVFTLSPKEVPATPQEIIGSTPGRRFPGDCYWKAGEYVSNRKMQEIMGDNEGLLEGVTLVHGTVGDGTTKIGHAWVEIGDKIFDGTKQQFYDKADYLKKMNAVSEHRYTPAETFRMMVTKKHYGPWEGTAGITAGPAPKKGRRRAA